MPLETTQIDISISICIEYRKGTVNNYYYFENSKSQILNVLIATYKIKKDW